jgi:O-methyltransferase
MEPCQPTVGVAPEVYLDLLKRCLTGTAYGEHYAPISMLRGTWKHSVFEPVRRLLAARNTELVRRSDPEAVAEGRTFHPCADTMVGLRRLDNLEKCVVDILDTGVRGDLMETGVWRGGSTIFMRAILKAYGDTERKVWVADSFQGLPPPDIERWPQDKGDKHWLQDHFAIPLEEVRDNFDRYGLLDDQVRFLPGYFKDTLPSAQIQHIAVLRLDGDMYGSTMEALVALYPKVSVGGYVIVDDYGAFQACRQAVVDYRTKHDVTDAINRIDWTGVWWRKTKPDGRSTCDSEDIPRASRMTSGSG